MNNTIELDNNYYLEIGKDENLPISDITDLKLKDIKEKNCLILYIDFSTIRKQEYKKILKRLYRIKKILKLNKIEIGYEKNGKKLLGIVENYRENDNNEKEFIYAINAIFYKNRKEMYEYIYDKSCEYLDCQFYGKNLCDFRNNKCGEKINTTSNVGCCRHYKIKWLGPITHLVKCEYLDDNHNCTAKCISCKLYTCDYLKKKGVKFDIKDILLLDTFFNPIQKYFIKYNVFTPKEKIIKRLLLT